MSTNTGQLAARRAESNPGWTYSRPQSITPWNPYGTMSSTAVLRVFALCVMCVLVLVLVHVHVHVLYGRPHGAWTVLNCSARRRRMLALGAAHKRHAFQSVANCQAPYITVSVYEALLIICMNTVLRAPDDVTRRHVSFGVAAHDSLSVLQRPYCSRERVAPS